jgi:predicted deacetylase
MWRISASIRPALLKAPVRLNFSSRIIASNAAAVRPERFFFYVREPKQLEQWWERIQVVESAIKLRIPDV